MQAAQKSPIHSSRFAPIAIAAALVVYCVAMGWERLGFSFAADDMMNLGHYFQRGPWGALRAQFLVWKGFYRPMGAAFYLPLYHWFGLDPRPFQAAMLLLLAVNTLLLFHLALKLGAGRLAASLAAVIVAYHAGLTSLQYNTDMIYDALCFLFFVGALGFYVGIREQGRRLRMWEMVVFLALYLCALNSKEMALTMPVVVAVYEWCYSERGRRWVWAAALSGVLAAASLYGKKYGVEPLLDQAAYQPVFTLQRFMAFQKGSLADLSGHLWAPGWHGVVAVWALATYLAWRRNRPLLRFAWAYMLVTPLPIAFLEKRLQGNLYVPLAGWALFAAVIFVDLVHAGAAALMKEPLFRRLGHRGAFGLLAASGALLWVNQMRYLKRMEVKPAAAAQGIVTSRVIGQLRKLNPHVEPHSQVVFLNDPFHDWDMTFIGTLWFGDRTVHVYNERTEQLSEDELERMDHVFEFREGRLVQLK
jgi:hypothetical protein